MSATAGEEPPSGVQGKGTASQPYDQGNKPEITPAETSDKEGTGTEPLSGQKGKGTLDEPYDKGNVSRNKNSTSSSIIDSILGRKNKDKANGSTVIDSATGAPPSDDQASSTVTGPDVKQTAAIAEKKHNLDASQQNAQIEEPTVKSDKPAEQPFTEPSGTTSTAKEPETTSTPAPATESSSTPAVAAPSATAAVAAAPVPAISEPASEPKGKETSEEDRGRGKEFQSYSGPRQMERSVSPGTLPDGRHAQTAGDRGESYVPSGKLGKLGSKLGFGHH